MKNLTVNDFQIFFRAIHAVEPFPWQTELAKEVLKKGRWPSLLDLPTGAGKTAAIDIAVFHLAFEAENGHKRRAPLRILFVIDRRIVVDAAFERAKKIAAALRSSKDGMVRAVAQRLSILSGDQDHPLDVVRLRGGVPQERDWARSPAQPLVVVSTVDQAGSRLLFRGYGVSPKMLPVHAGLVGTDALWLLDEVHLSKPFEETLDGIAAGHDRDKGGLLAEHARLAPFAVVKLSATPGAERPAESFPHDDFDIRSGAPQTFLDRIKAHKLTSLVEIAGNPADVFAHHALCLAGLKTDEKSTGKTAKKKKNKKGENNSNPIPVHRVGVVVNRVALARQVFETITRETGEGAETILLTGRLRPLDRDQILEKIEPLFASKERREPEKPIILVATQTIEAGADLDLDALVTEIAPLDSLRQRFGRLDRLGLLGESRAVILYPPGKSVKKDRDNPWTALTGIYGDAAYNTKQWLAEMKGAIDFGIDYFQDKMASLGPEKIAAMLSPRSQAPVLLPPYVDLWSTTSPVPLATPDPSLFLHGPGTAADVQIIWRADIDPKDEDLAEITLTLCPPSALESLSVPIWAVRRWLKERGTDEADFADVPQKTSDWENGRRSGGRSALRWADGVWKRMLGDDIKPGDTIVAPSSFGGCDQWGWAPLSRAVVADLGADAHYRQRLKGALRVTPATLANALLNERGPEGEAAAAEIWNCISRFISDTEDEVDGEAIRERLVNEDNLPETWLRLLKNMARRRVAVEFYDQETRRNGFILYAKKPLAAGLLDKGEAGDDGNESITDRTESSEIGMEVPLSDHLQHVAQLAHDFALRSGLDERFIYLVTLAARLHDLGKADPRFQADLRSASALAAISPELAALLAPKNMLLAKSSRVSDGRRGRSRSLKAAPDNFRHEALSVALASKHPEVVALSEKERDLVLWLIGTHHGYGKPFFLPSDDPASEIMAEVEVDKNALSAAAREAPLRMDQGWFELVERLRRRYGPWELARLESILRLADHGASAEEQEKANGQSSIIASGEVNP